MTALALVEPQLLPAGSYTRISKARGAADDPETTSGVRRQAEENEALAQSKGLQIIDTYVDNDISASGRKRRPQWERLLSDLEDGRFRHLVVWHPDRLLRVRGDLDRLIEVCNRRSVQVMTVRAGEVDLRTATGRFQNTVLTAVNTYELEHLSERQIAKHDQLAREGKPNGGGRPFGYERDRLTLREPTYLCLIADHAEVVVDEPAIIKEMAERALAGEALYRLSQELNRRGVPTVRLTRWAPATLRQVLTQARISGRREVFGRTEEGKRISRGRIVGKATEQWNAIITAEQSDKLRRKLLDPQRWKTPGQTSSSHALGGLIYCSCGSRMFSRGKGAVRCDVCFNSVQTKYFAEPLYAAVKLRVDSGGLVKALEQAPDTSGLYEELAGIESQLALLAQLWADQQLSTGEWQSARDGLHKRRNSLTVQLERSQQSVGLTGLSDLLQTNWGAMSDAQRRCVLGYFVDKIVVSRATTRGRYDPARVKILWKR